MQFVEGWWLPDDDTYFAALLKKDKEYQKKHRDTSLSFVKNFRTAIDIGAHVGFWSKDLSERFNRVFSFEPLEEHCLCFRKNVISENCTLIFSALGEKVGLAQIRFPGVTSANAKIGQGGVEVTVNTLDSYENLQDIDYIKIDVEGFELNVLKGAEQTIRKHKPVITLEQKDGAAEYGFKRYAASELLQTWGMKLKGRVVDDLIYAFD